MTLNNLSQSKASITVITKNLNKVHNLMTSPIFLMLGTKTVKNQLRMMISEILILTMLFLVLITLGSKTITPLNNNNKSNNNKPNLFNNNNSSSSSNNLKNKNN
jgi:hypothetical protein